MRSRLSNAKSDVNRNREHLINKSLAKTKNIVTKVPENKTFKIEENEKIIGIVERILELNNQTKCLVDCKFFLAQ